MCLNKKVCDVSDELTLSYTDVPKVMDNSYVKIRVGCTITLSHHENV